MKQAELTCAGAEPAGLHCLLSLSGERAAALIRTFAICFTLMTYFASSVLGFMIFVQRATWHAAQPQAERVDIEEQRQNGLHQQKSAKIEGDMHNGVGNEAPCTFEPPDTCTARGRKGWLAGEQKTLLGSMCTCARAWKDGEFQAMRLQRAQENGIM